MLNNPNRSALYLHQNIVLPVAPANFIEVNAPLVVNPVIPTIETNRMSGAMNSKDTAIDTCQSSAAFLASVNMRDSGAVMTAPTEYAELLKVSGFKISDTPPANTYQLENLGDNIARASALVFMDGKQFSFTNTLVGSSEINLTVGQIAKVDTTLSGYIDNSVPEDVANPTPTLNQNPLSIVSCADVITIGGDVIPAEAIVFKTNPDIANVYTMGGDQGLKQDTITDYGLTCEITFPVESATFGDAASLIQAGTISAIRCVIGQDRNTGLPIDGKSTVFLADASKAVTYTDTVNQDLLQRVLTLRLFDDVNPALRIITGEVSGL